MWKRDRAAIALALALCSIGLARSADYYTWTDEDGVTHLVTALEDVPAKYRDAVKKSRAIDAPAPASAVPKGAAGAVASGVPGSTPGARKFAVPYQAFEGTSRRVIIPVTLNGSVSARMAVDTGAPGMVISASLAQRLGLFSRDSGTLFIAAGGIGGTELAVLTIVDSIEVQQARSTFVPTTVIASSPSPEFEGLVGMDFLANYTVHIDSKQQLLVFEETPCGADCRGGHDESWWRRTFAEFREERDRWRERTRELPSTTRENTKLALEYQARESERLLQRLAGYASDNAVPQHWR